MGCKHLLVIGDSRNMKDFVNNESVDLVVTSPPYWNLKRYGGQEIGFSDAYTKYINNISEVLKECSRVLREGRFFCINVGTAVSDEEMKSIPSDIIQTMRSLDFTFRKEIIWEKPKGTQGLWQRGTTKFLKRYPYPCFFNLNIVHEYILIFQKKGKCNISPEILKRHKLPEDFIKEVAWSVWRMPVSMTKGHPAPFPEQLPDRLIKLYTIEGETVLDPFAGTGTVMKVARDLKRNSILYEVNPEYLNIIKRKVCWGQQGLEKEQYYELQFQPQNLRFNGTKNLERTAVIEQVG